MFEVTPQPGSPKPGTERPHYRAEHLAEEAAPGSGSLLPDRSCIGRRGSRTQCWELVRSEPGLCWHSPKGTERCHVDFLGSVRTVGEQA